jgi:thiamine biosynthesis protein ThiS
MAEIEVTVNGESRRVAAGSTVLDLLAFAGCDARTVAVEHNGEILPRTRYGATRLAGGDRLEIVHFVQGGSGASSLESEARPEAARRAGILRGAGRVRYSSRSEGR